MNEHVQRGLACKQRGQLAEAADRFRQALDLDPHDFLALTNLAILHSEQGQLDEAETFFRQAARCNPQEAGAFFNLGLLLAETGRGPEAVACFRQTVALNPNHSNALRNLAALLMDQKNAAEAVWCHRELVRIHPDDSSAYNNLGNILKFQGQLSEAIACYRNASALAQHEVVFQYNLGIALREQGQLQEAVTCCREALRLNPHHALTHLLLGDILRDQGHFEDARASYGEAVRCDPNHADTYNNMASLFFSLGEIEQAKAAYIQAIRLNPGQAVARFNLGIIWLMAGEYEKGWPEYEFRFKEPHNPSRIFSHPRWDGGLLHGQTILLYAEQGLGDTIQFIRYACLVKDRGGRVVVECQLPLVRLLTEVAGVDQVVTQGQPLPHFDVQIPLMSLAGVFKTMLENIPRDIPYIHANADLQEHWRREMRQLFSGEPQAPSNPMLNVGIVWQGSPTQAEDRYRSVALGQFAPLARVPGVRLVSLQVGSGREKLADAPFDITDLGGRFGPSSMNDLAAAIPNLDLVVTVCTSVAHLAGAMGVPAWVALKRFPYWVWQLEREDCLWYPSLRLFRQKKLGDWAEVFQRIALDVRRISVLRTEAKL